MNREKYVEPIPSWALCAIINDDRTGLEDEGYFTPCPAFGLPCDVYDCVCIKFV